MATNHGLCAGWRTEKFRGGVVVRLCPECGLPASRQEAAGAALAAVEALFAAHFGDDANGALETLRDVLAYSLADAAHRNEPEVDAYRGALHCVQGVLKSIREAAEE